VEAAQQFVDERTATHFIRRQLKRLPEFIGGLVGLAALRVSTGEVDPEIGSSLFREQGKAIRTDVARSFKGHAAFLQLNEGSYAVKHDVGRAEGRKAFIAITPEPLANGLAFLEQITDDAGLAASGRDSAAH
jgi:hypothetical protein